MPYGYLVPLLLIIAYITMKAFQISAATSASSLRKPIDGSKYDDL